MWWRLFVASLWTVAVIGCDGSKEEPTGGGGSGGGGAGGAGGGGSLVGDVKDVCELAADCGKWSDKKREACVATADVHVQIAALSGCDAAPYYECVLTSAECMDGLLGADSACSEESAAFTACHDAATESLAPEPAAAAEVKTFCACAAEDEVDLYTCYLDETARLTTAEVCGCSAEANAALSCLAASQQALCPSYKEPGAECEQAVSTYAECLLAQGC